MRLSVLLLVTSLLPGICSGDTQLDFMIQDKQAKSKLSYLIRDHQIRVDDGNTKRINIYDAGKRVYDSYAPGKDKHYRITDELISRKVESLDKARRQRIQETEQRLQDKINQLKPEQQQALESLINQLKYPDLYGQQTRLSIHPIKKTHQVQQVKCQLYRLERDDKLLKTFCMAERKDLGLSVDEYKSMRSLLQFNYSVQTRLLMARGESGFTMVDYEEKNMPGIPIEIIDHTGKEKRTIMALSGVSHKKFHERAFLQTGEK